MSDLIKRGTVTSVDYENGTVKVVYEDKDDSTSFDLPLFSFEYNPPNIGDMVIAIFLPNDTTQGYVIGKPFNQNNKPSNGNKNIYRKDLDNNNYFEFDKSTETLTINVKNVIVKGNFSEEGE